MKLLCILSLFISLTSIAISGEFSEEHRRELGISYIGMSVFFGIYGNPLLTTGVVVGGTTSLAISDAERQANQQQAAKLLIKDIQEFYLSGNPPANLQASILGLQSRFPSLSDAEAVDDLTQIAESILQ